MEFKVTLNIELSNDVKQLVSSLLAGAVAAGVQKEIKTAPKAAPAVIDEEDEAPKTKAVVKKAVAKKAPEAEEAEEEEEAPIKKAVAKKATVVKQAEPKQATKRQADPTQDEFNDLSAEDQLTAIQAVVSRHGKKGNTADVRSILGIFDVRKATELDEVSYEQFYELIMRYQNGEDAEAIVSEYI